jgi:sec-independent protein translocase protein TatA
MDSPRSAVYAAPMTGLTQPWHIVLILLLALMLFGGKRLPEIGRSLGSGMREFKDSLTGHDQPRAPQLASPEANAPQAAPAVAEPAESEAVAQTDPH